MLNIMQVSCKCNNAAAPTTPVSKKKMGGIYLNMSKLHFLGPPPLFFLFCSATKSFQGVGGGAENAT